MLRLAKVLKKIQEASYILDIYMTRSRVLKNKQRELHIQLETCMICFKKNSIQVSNPTNDFHNFKKNI